MKFLTNLFNALQTESKHIFGDKSVLLVMFGGVLFYALLYPSPYEKNLSGEQAIAVVDLDNSALSRKLIRMADATPKVTVKIFKPSLAAAQPLLADGIVQGILVIPHQFERNLYLGIPVQLAFAGDASYFLIYGDIVEGLLTTTTTLAVESQILMKIMTGENPARIPGEIMAFNTHTQAVFNSSGGYLNYIVPAVFVLILHQTLLIAAATVTIKDRALRRSLLINPALGLAIFSRFSLFVMFYFILALLYFGFFFKFYGIPHSAEHLELIIFTLLFLSTTTLFAICLGYVLPRPELITIIVLLSSLPLVFTAGFAWPTVNLPSWLDQITLLIPAKPAIQGFLKLNQMGTPLSNLVTEMSYLSGMFFAFLLIVTRLIYVSSKAAASFVNKHPSSN